MDSIWSRQTHIEKREPLHENVRVNTVVIGAGMAGILTAYFLEKQGIDVIVIEANKIAGGQTKNTTAKITSQHGLIYHKLIKEIGKENAKSYAMANEDAIKLYERIVKEEKISCHFEKLPAYLYSLEKEKTELLKEEAATAAELGIKAKFVSKEELGELPFEAVAGVCFEEQAQFHPLAFVEQLSVKLKIYEGVNALSVKNHVVITDKLKITADNIVFATHYPFINVPGFYFLRQHQERSYVIALKGTNPLTGMYYGVDEGGLSLRTAGEYLLLGGGGHRTGKQFQDNAPAARTKEKEGYAYLRDKCLEYYPYAKEEARWAAQDCMPHDGIPFIGRYSMLRSYWHVATGFHKWGMTSSMVAAVIISNRICGKDNPYEAVFSPQRFWVRAGIKDLMKDILESVKGLSKGWLGRKEQRCPHMGCRLEWNPEENTWDCPCHGSRFEENGALIDNPAQREKSK